MSKMTTSTSTSKPKQNSRWGSLLSGAVANLESRLDTFFEEETNAGRQRQQTSAAVTPPRRSTSSSRLEPVKQDARLPLYAQDDQSGPPTAALAKTEDIAVETQSTPLVEESTTLPRDAASNDDGISSVNVNGTGDSVLANVPPVHVANESRTNVDSLVMQPQSELSNADLHMKLEQFQSDLEIITLQRQEDVHAYGERIDALQSKLQFFAKEAADKARQEAEGAPADAMQKRLAAKEEQIALLLEEGQKLSKVEVTHAGIARKLRMKVAEDARALAELKRKHTLAEKTNHDLSEKLKRLEYSQKETLSKYSRITQIEKELSQVKANRDELQTTVQVLRAQIDDEGRRGLEVEAKASSAALEQQKSAFKLLEEDLRNAKVESKSLEDRLRGELREAREEVEREHDRKRMLESQMRNEIMAVESRLEALRARSEEASTAGSGDSNAKMLRQIEVMQSQYAVATENWRGIEASLQARLTAIEKERDETARAESDARRRARESATTVRRLQEQLDESSRTTSILQQEMSEKNLQAERLGTRVRDFEASLKEATSQLERERTSWKTTMDSRLEEEKIKWRQDLANTQPSEPPLAHAESPGASARRPHLSEFASYSIRRSLGRQPTAGDGAVSNYSDRSLTRRTSSRMYKDRADIVSPTGFDSGRSTPLYTASIHESASVHTIDADDVEHDASSQRTINDVVSGSTAAAGPSVQLVERMSAAVRRLESEKAATKDETLRLMGQRDDARKEVVRLIAEVEGGRQLQGQVDKLRQELTELGSRYQTTLEMLGEKSERVEELEADVADLKKIYRELVETMR